MSEFIEDQESLSGNDLGGETDPVTQEPEDGEGTDQEGNKEQDKTPEEGGGDKYDDQQPGHDEIMERLDLLAEQAESMDVKTLTESIRSLVDLMSLEQQQPRDVYIPPDIPIEGYRTWDYPIRVDYLISLVGFEDIVPQSADYDNPDQFLEDFQDMAFACFQGTVFKDFYIDKVYDASDSKLFDSHPEEEPEPDTGEEEPDDAVEQLLSHLETIDTTLAEIQQADLEYYQAVYDYQAEMLKLQTADTGATIILCIAVFAVLGELIMKHLLEVFR